MTDNACGRLVAVLEAAAAHVARARVKHGVAGDGWTEPTMAALASAVDAAEGCGDVVGRVVANARDARDRVLNGSGFLDDGCVEFGDLDDALDELDGFEAVRL